MVYMEFISKRKKDPYNGVNAVHGVDLFFML